jgi:hypothetical protein
MAKIPKLQTISFFGTCPANANITLVSNFIDVPFNTKKIRASFAPGVERLMTLKYFISGDKNAPTTEEPQGINILAQIGQARYITGDDEFKEFEHETIHQVAGGYLKVYAENSDVFDHTIDSQVTIEFIQEDDNA